MAESRYRVLVVDDEANQRSALASMLTGWGYEAAVAANGAEALESLSAYGASAIVTDLMMPVMDGPELLRRLKDQGNPPPAIVLTAFGSPEAAIELVHDLGAYWFLEKPLQAGALRLLLERAIAQRSLTDYSETLERRLSEHGVLGELVGGSQAMQEVYSLIRQVAPTRATVLITGESGTGKELAARAIHNLSPRRAAAFVALNCAALPETLIESELFGHEKGAFTGAVERRRGCFELAHGGTILLDEIGEMPMSTQAKLLRVLEDRKVRRLASPVEVDVDVRVLAATNRNLREEVKQNRFRDDLFFRLNVFQVALPPLRERPDDISTLCLAMVRELNARNQCRVSGVHDETLNLLKKHDWPGNARELRNVLERAVIVAGEGPLLPNHLAGLRLGGRDGQQQAAPRGDEISLPVGTTINEAERALIELTLRHTGNNRARTSSILGISQKTLFNKLREYGSSASGE